MRNRILIAACMLASRLLAACAPPPEDASRWSVEFTDATERLGLRLPRSIDGIAIFDRNRDGYYDFYAPNHGVSPRLCTNIHGRRFDCTTAARFGLSEGDLHGVAAADIDNDGDPDLYQSIGGGRGFGKLGSPFNRLYLNLGNGRFEDVAADRMRGDPYGRARGVRVVDYDRDGLPDVFVSNARSSHGRSSSRMYRQLPSGTFLDASASLGLAFPSNEVSFQDLDADGYPDLLARHRIYWNEAGHRFTPALLVTDAARLPNRLVRIVTDVDNDGRVDLVLFDRGARERRDAYGLDARGRLWISMHAPKDAIDRDTVRFSCSSDDIEIIHLTHKNSRPEELAAAQDHTRVFLGKDKKHPPPYGYDLGDRGSFSLRHLAVGTPEIDEEGLYIYRSARGRWTVVAVGNQRAERHGRFSIGIAADAPLDGLDHAGLEAGQQALQAVDTAPALKLTNRGGRRFAVGELAVAGGLPTGGFESGVGADLDNDGDVDLFLVGRGTLNNRGRDVLLLNRGDGTFVHGQLPDYASRTGSERAAHVWDIDNDGRLDLFITTKSHDEYTVLLNRTESGHHWIDLRLDGHTATARDAIGTRVEIDGVWGTQVRQVGTEAVLNMSVLPLHFGLGAVPHLDEVRVGWNSGLARVPGDSLSIDERNTLREEPDGAGHARGGERP